MLRFKEMLTQLTDYAHGMRIMYVEDEVLIRENTALLLKTIFSDVVCVSQMVNKPCKHIRKESMKS